jgi:hypothetical protein
MALSRRAFLTTAVAGAASLGLEGEEQKKTDSSKTNAAAVAGKRPIIVCAGNGYDYLDDAFAFLKSGGDTLDALSRQTGVPRDELLKGLSQHLPELVDQLTPNGRLPTPEEAARIV